MRYKPLLVVFTAILLSANIFGLNELDQAAQDVISPDALRAGEAIDLLRTNKQRGLDVLFATYESEITAVRGGLSKPEFWDRITAALDGVARQKDAYTSRLFWHTDLNKAKSEAARTGKPILTLRLLGNLDQEYSCANSRFFRSILYSDPAIANNLRSNYVLHWQSVRPAPKITIEFGDGRKLVRTITGNSIHYVIDKNGIMIDALPGLYAPKTFNNYLSRINSVSKLPGNARSNYLGYREDLSKELLIKWQNELELAGKTEGDIYRERTNEDDGTSSSTEVFAIDAAPRAVTKRANEIVTLSLTSSQFDQLNRNVSVSGWRAIAALNGTVDLSPESIQLMRSKTQNVPDKDFDRLIKNTKMYIAMDTVQNEYRFHSKLISWQSGRLEIPLDSFNRRVYRELFLTPDSDKWLGLYEPDVYAAIDGNGIQ